MTPKHTTIQAPGVQPTSVGSTAAVNPAPTSVKASAETSPAESPEYPSEAAASKAEPTPTSPSYEGPASEAPSSPDVASSPAAPVTTEKAVSTEIPGAPAITKNPWVRYETVIETSTLR